MSLLGTTPSSSVNIQALFLTSYQYLAGQTLKENSIVLAKTLMVLDQTCVLTLIACFSQLYFQFLVFMFLFHFSVAHQAYRVVVHEESVILGNDVQFKCNIQSFVTDFVHITNWIDSEGSTFSVGQSIGNDLSEDIMKSDMLTCWQLLSQLL